MISEHWLQQLSELTATFKAYRSISEEATQEATPRQLWIIHQRQNFIGQLAKQILFFKRWLSVVETVRTTEDLILLWQNFLLNIRSNMVHKYCYAIIQKLNLIYPEDEGSMVYIDVDDIM